MILPIEAPRITEPKTNKKTLPLKAKKKVSLTVHVRFLSINLQYLIFTFWGFYSYEKKCKVCCMCFFLHLSPWGESCYFTPIFSAKILPTNYVSPRLPFVMFILQKILTNFAHYYGKIQLLAINHLWKACFMLYAICTSCRVHIFCLFHLFHIFSRMSNYGSIFFFTSLKHGTT